MQNSYKCAGKLLATVLSTEVALCTNTNCKCSYKDMEQYYDLTFSSIKKSVLPPLLMIQSIKLFLIGIIMSKRAMRFLMIVN